MWLSRERLRWPPVVEGVSFAALGVGFEGATAVDEQRLQRLHIEKGLVGHWLVDQSPQPLCSLGSSSRHSVS